MKFLLILLISYILTNAADKNTTTLTHIVINNDDGGLISGGAWDSNDLHEKTTLLFYIDPDEKSHGEKFNAITERLEKHFSNEKFQVVIIINLDATWTPNAVIRTFINNRAIKHPNRQYVEDRKKILVREWGMSDDAYNVLIINPKGELLFRHTGSWNKKKIEMAQRILHTIIEH